MAAALAGLLAGSLAAGCAGAPPPPAPGFYRWPGTAAEQAVRLAQEQGRTADLPALRRLAAQPVARWLTGDDAAGVAAQVVTGAAAAGQLPVLVAYDIPGRDCGAYSRGGAADPAAYRAWVDRLAAAIGDRAAWVVLEPDAVALTVTGCATAGADRYQLLAYAVGELKAHPKVRVYLDAGNPGYAGQAAQIADGLRAAGLQRADGFAVNVSNFYTTPQSSAYGRQLSGLLGGKHFVIDTSRNGNGALAPTAWCNPPGRALGAPPTTATGDPSVDAFLWVKNPGESDGDCGRGEPPAGEFWLDYALGLAK
ncbi:glycoside hydrolase family 6 protein [Kitasatospora viridis]|uniref:glycoside hydrolase family 6 protein n=1 Tax=Kitasatospora viridis TaxID=281105 RepID=UPI0011A71544|nr:glycoside hydrolase family 6 protein [Kitasatospora viridis]